MKKKLVLINSDSSIDENNVVIVIDWLDYYKQGWIKINNTEKLVVLNINQTDLSDDIEFKILPQKISFKYPEDILSYWCRNGKLQIASESTLQLNINHDYSINYLSKEFKVVSEFLLNRIEAIENRIGRQNDYLINKYQTLEIAKVLGLNIPRTKIIFSVNELRKFKSNVGRIITKALNVSSISEGEYLYTKGTVEVTEAEISDLKTIFLPSLFQEFIESKFEIRVFYLRSHFYSTGIISFGSQSADSRDIDPRVPPRFVPIALPANLKLKLSKLMNRLNLDSGSIDLLYSNSNEFVLLEINPMGQFSFYSYICNYYVEKIIAIELCKKTRNPGLD